MPESLRESMRSADPDRLINAVATYVETTVPGCRVDVLLADYRISGLWPVLGEKHVAEGSLSTKSAAARAFASQETVLDDIDGGFRALIPISVWSERVGVLVVEFDSDTGRRYLGALEDIADELAVAVLAADRATDRYRRARRRGRLTMAAEMQWELLPGRALGGSNFRLAGQLEPAYAVCGDHFDWSLNGDRLTLTALNGDGNGIPATLLTVVAVNAMRNARRSGANLVEQAELASDAVFSLHGGRRHVATLLLDIDLTNGEVQLIDAGSPKLLRMRGTQVSSIDVDHQLPLGMFADTRYAPQRVVIEPGDRLFVVSDGVHAAAFEGAPQFGERGLISAVRATRMQPPAEAVGSLMLALHEYHDGHDLADDAVIVCFDWLGGPGLVTTGNRVRG